MKDSLLLRGAIYSRFDRELFQASTPAQSMMTAIAKLVGYQADRVLEKTGQVIEHHVMTTTALAAPFNKGHISWQETQKIFEHVCGTPPRSLLNTYECSGWGYVLRYLNRLATENRTVLVTIFDANIYDWEYWKVHHEWGQSGFGVGTLLIELAEDPSALKVSTSRSSNPIAEFAIEIRKQLQADKTLVGALPFFPVVTQSIFNNTLKQFNRLPDLYERWGHCFGSDPWLSIILAAQCNPSPETMHRYLACSLAFSGYFSLAKVNIAPNAFLELNPSANDMMRLQEAP